MPYDLFSLRSKLRAHVLPGKPVEESVQHSQAGRDKAYSTMRCPDRGATVKARLLKKVDLKRSLLQPAEVLRWDEPMNYLDVDSREMIEDGLIRGNPTMLLIEHDEQFIESVASTVINL